MNPWLQRFLIAWAAGAVTTGAVVGTAKKPHKLKKKRRKKREDGTEEPVQLGQVALKDARLPDERGLTVPEWRHQVIATGSAVGAKLTGVFKRTPKVTPRFDDDAPPGVKAPDEVQAADGTTVAKAAPRRKRKGAHAKGRAGAKGKRRPQATLWDSAKESFKQTVKDTVREEVKETPVGNALDALKTVGAKVKEGATKVGAGAATLVNRAMEGNPDAPRDPNAPPQPSLQERLDKAGAAIARGVERLAEGAKNDDATPPPVDGAPAASAPPAPAEDGAQAEGDAGTPGERVDVEAGVKAAGVVASEVAADVAKNLKKGFSAVGSWLQGPGAPGYGKRRRPQSGEIVDAVVEPVEPKDTPAPGDAPSLEDAPREADARDFEDAPSSARENVAAVDDDEKPDDKKPDDEKRDEEAAQ